MRRWLHRLRDEDGSATIEFVIFFPFVFGLFLATFELGMLLVRQTMLERSLDLAIRQVRLGLIEEDDLTHNFLKKLICAQGTMIPDCTNQLRLEMLPVDPRDLTLLKPDVDCVDRAQPVEDLRDFKFGVSNELVILRACALFYPYFPINVLGFPNVPANVGSAYAHIASTAFVIEPS